MYCTFQLADPQRDGERERGRERGGRDSERNKGLREMGIARQRHMGRDRMEERNRLRDNGRSAKIGEYIWGTDSSNNIIPTD